MRNLYRTLYRDTRFDAYRTHILHSVNVIYRHSNVLPNATYEIDTSSLQCWITAFSVYVATVAMYCA